MKYERLCLALCLVLLFVAPGVTADKLHLATGEWPPYVSKGLQHDGVTAHIVTEAFAAEGIACRNYISSMETGI